MKIKVAAVYRIEDVQVVMERIKNTAMGAPRWKATVVAANGAYVFNIISYNNEKDAAYEAYIRYMGPQ